jgi:hypothetical protein
MQRYILGLLFVLFLNFANANDFVAQVKHAEISHQNGYYFLAADLEYHLSPQPKEALQNGVPLFWNVDVHLNQVRHFWWDKVKLKYSLRYQLQYHALLNMYRVKNENTGETHNFSTLSAALDNMSIIRGLPLINIKNVEANRDYVIAIKILFEDDKLPLPLQTQVIANPQWQLSSDWTYWNLLVDKIQP